MTADEMLDMLLTWTMRNSGHDAERRYLGMSAIADCPLRLYRNVVNGPQPPSLSQSLLFAEGYLHERDLKARLQACGLYAPGSERELTAPFDARFKGHTDGEVDVRLLEIKSMADYVYQQIEASGTLTVRYVWQANAYMRYGGYHSAVMVCKNRDDGAIAVYELEYSPEIGQAIEDKARAVLAAVDADVPPECACGNCAANPRWIHSGRTERART